jgi:hypothetical protein
VGQVIKMNKMPHARGGVWPSVSLKFSGIGLALCTAFAFAAVSATANPSTLSETSANASTQSASGPSFSSNDLIAQVLETSATASALAVPDAPRDLMAPNNPIFYDQPLMLRQYGYGVLTGVVAGSLLFYIGNAFEGMIFNHNSRKGYLSFTGIRYEHSRRFLGMPAGGPFIGGTLGLWGGSSLMVFFMGDADEEPGSVLWTVAGGALTTVAALALADVAGVGEERGMLPFIPLIVLPPIGAVGGYHVSRWFNDAKRRRVTEPGGEHTGYNGPKLFGPRVGMDPGPDGIVTRIEALRLTF